MNLGIDIGRVLISPDPGGGGGDTSFIGGSIETALATPPYPGMFDAVPRLVQLFGGRVWLVSKARPKMQEKTRLWLAHHHFFERTGVAPGHLRFCMERPQKAEHCRDLKIGYFIDDRLDVLEHLDGVVPNRYLFGPQKPGSHAPAGVTAVPSWPAALAAVSANIAVAA